MTNEGRVTKVEGPSAISLRDLRRSAGFSSARDFALELGMAPATYARYEQYPDRIPTAAAWQIADRLRCTIDAVVGRDASRVAPGSTRGPQQRRYDALGAEARELADEFMSFLEARERQRAGRGSTPSDAECDRLMFRFLDACEARASRNPEAYDTLLFGTPWERREAFRTFLEATCAKTGRDVESRRPGLDRLMAAYDREFAPAGGWGDCPNGDGASGAGSRG